MSKGNSEPVQNLSVSKVSGTADDFKNTIILVNKNCFCSSSAEMKTYKPEAGDEITFKLTVRNKATNKTKEYTYTEILKLPYKIEKYSD